MAATRAAASTLSATPAEAVAVPPPGQSTILVRDFYEGAPPNITIVGQIYLNACPGGPVPPRWGINTGPSFLATLSCSPDGDPTPKPPFSLPTDPPAPPPGTGS